MDSYVLELDDYELAMMYESLAILGGAIERELRKGSIDDDSREDLELDLRAVNAMATTLEGLSTAESDLEFIDD